MRRDRRHELILASLFAVAHGGEVAEHLFFFVGEVGGQLPDEANVLVAGAAVANLRHAFAAQA